MEINRHNYQAFLLDRLEGKLSVARQLELEKFLLLNPDCAGELTDIEPWTLPPEPIQHWNRESLKKIFPGKETVLSGSNFDMFCIARMEGDLNDEQVRAHQAMLEAEDNYLQQWLGWKQARLEGETLAFPGKDRLRRRKGSGSRILWTSMVSAAAALVLLLLLFRGKADGPEQENMNRIASEIRPTQELPVKPEAEALVVEADVVQSMAEPSSERPTYQRDYADNRPAAIADENIRAGENLPPESIRPAPGTLSASQFNVVSVAGGAVPDRIKPLDIAPATARSGGLTLAQISDKGLQEMVEDYAEEKDLSLWKIADAGVRGINKLAGSDISLLASRDENGDISGFRLKSRRFSVSSPVGRDQ